ncbi:MAG: tetratricopeptide repeat protein [Roseivirga sp.]|nr:tetratricopeptide repeat protein [Roseivirga sp.]
MLRIVTQASLIGPILRLTLLIHAWLIFSYSMPVRGQEVQNLQIVAESIGAQYLDSALNLLESADSIAIEENNLVGLSQNHWIRSKIFYQQRSYDSMYYYAELGIKAGKEVEDISSLAKIYNLLGVMSRRRGDYDFALSHYRSSLSYRVLLKDSVGMGKTYQNIGALYQQKGVPDSSHFYNSKSFAIKIKTGDSLSIGKAISNFGAYYFEIGMYDSAINLFRTAFEIYESEGYLEGVARVFNNIGASYRSLGHYRRALSHYTEGIKLYDSLGLDLEKANSFHNTAYLFSRLGDFDKSLSYYNEALSVYTEVEMTIGQAETYLNMADVMLFTQNPDAAIDYLKDSEGIYQGRSEYGGLPSVYHGYGRAYAQKSQFELAERNFLKSIDLMREANNRDAMGAVHNSYAVALYQSGQLRKSELQYKMGLSLGKEFKKPDLVRASLLGLSEVNEALGNSKRAYDYRLHYGVVKDSLDNVEKSRQIAELREIYETEQKDKQISQLELENELVNAQSEANAAQAAKQRADKLTFIVLTAALLMVAIILYFYLRQRLMLARLREKEEKESHIKSVNELLVQQQTKTLEAMVQGQEEERLRIAKELHDHFGSLMAAVKVNLTTVVAKGNIDQTNDKQMENLSVLVDQACEDIRSLSHSMHVGISESFGLIPALEDLAHSINASGRVEVAFHSASCTGKLDSTMEVMTYRLIQELVSNALKHSQATKLTIQVTCLGDIVNIIVEDNGMGFDAQHYMEQSEGMGLKSMQERIMSLQGEFEVDSQPGKGTTVIIDLPVSVEQRMDTL